MNQWINKSLNRWIHKALDRWINKSLNRWINKLLNRWINKSLNRWFNKSLNRWINKSLNRWPQDGFRKCRFQSRADRLVPFRIVLGSKMYRLMTFWIILGPKWRKASCADRLIPYWIILHPKMSGLITFWIILDPRMLPGGSQEAPRKLPGDPRRTQERPRRSRRRPRKMPGRRLGVPGARSGFWARQGKGQTGVLKGTGSRECAFSHGFLQDSKNRRKQMKVFPTSPASHSRGSHAGESEFSCCSSVRKVNFLQTDQSRFRGCGVGESSIC